MKSTAPALLPTLLFLVTAAASHVVAAPVWIDKEENQRYTARHEASFVQAGDKFYLFGGRENARTLDTYDYASDTWTRSKSAPIPFNHFQATQYQGLIWVIGAFKTNNFPNEPPAESIYVFDPANDVWMEGPEIPEDRRRGSTGLVVHDDTFYIVGGNTIGHNGGYVDWFDKFDPQTGEWTLLTDAPRPRDHFHAEVANDKLYAIGGRLSGGPGGTFAPLIAEVDVYDFETETWSTLAPESNLPTPRAAAAVAPFGGTILVIGGEGNGRAYDTVEALNPTSNTWETLDSLNHARHGTQAIASGDGVYIAVGSPKQGGGNQRNMEVYNVDAPSGSPSQAGILSATAAASIVGGVPESIRFAHVAGNEGVYVNRVSLSGVDAADFAVTSRASNDPFLILTGSAQELVVEYTGLTQGASASLDIAYSGSETISVALTGVPVPEPGTAVSLIIGAFCLAFVRARRF